MITNTIISFTLPQQRMNAERNAWIPGFREQDFRTDSIGTSDCNSFIPIIGYLNHNLITFEDSDTRVLEYYMPWANPATGFYRSYDRLVQTFHNGQSPMYLKYKVAGVEHKIFAHRGILYDQDMNILMCLALEREYAFATPIETLQTTLDETKIILIIDERFNLPIYKNARKKLDELLISRLKAASIDIVHTTRINSWILKNNFVQPKFKSVKEQQKYLKEVSANLLID